MSIVDTLLVNQEIVWRLEQRKWWFKMLHHQNSSASRQSVRCNEMKRSWQTSTADGILEGPLCQLPTSKKECKKKKKKLMKGLKKWTGVADNGHRAYEQWTKAIKDDVEAGKYTLWEKAFCKIHRDYQERRQDDTLHIVKYAVNKSLVWEL
jgi:hypothetical protein